MPHRVFDFRTAGLPGGSVKVLLVGWAVAEFLALALAIKILGLGGAILLMIASSALGVVLLRRLGLEAARHLRGVVAGGAARDGVMLDGTVAAFGAVLLILPGFVTDVAGLALAAPSLRQRLLARFGGTVGGAPRPVKRNASPDIIDLAPTDWTVVESPRQP